MLPVAVVEVGDRRAFRIFRELPLAAFGPTAAIRAALPIERRRLKPDRNPYFERGDAAYFLARRDGKPAGRIAAHLPQAGETDGRFGFFLAPDAEIGVPLIDAAAAWLRGKGCTSMSGPLSFEPEDGAGVLVISNREQPVTARPWTPEQDGAVLEQAGLAVAAELATFVVPASDEAVDGEPADLAVPFGLEPYADPALRLRTPAGVIVAVPDVAAAVATVGVRGAWALARRARRRDWQRAVVTAVDGPPAELVRALVGAAATAGYREILAPWSPDPGTEPLLVHRLYRLDL